MNQPEFQVGFIVFPNLTQLDLAGPYEVFQRMPGARVHLISKTSDPVRSEHGLPIVPTTTFQQAPDLDMLVVPGGFGVNEAMLDDETRNYVGRAGQQCQFLGSVCTGSLLLGAAGLLKGRRATCHWMSLKYLANFGATPVSERCVWDGNLITGGGVTAGIDFALAVVAKLAGQQTAEEIQLAIEYAPEPPFNCGTPETAPPALVDSLVSKWSPSQKKRQEIVRRFSTLQ